MVAGMGALCAGLAAIAIRRVPTAILHFDTSTAASQLSLGLTKSMQSMEVPSEVQPTRRTLLRLVKFRSNTLPHAHSAHASSKFVA